MRQRFKTSEYKNIGHLTRSIKLRLMFALDVVMVLIPFLFIALFFYEGRMDRDFSLRVNWLFILLFVVVYVICAIAYQVFQIQIVRIQELVYSQILSLVVTDFVMFIIIWLVNMRFPNVIPMLIAFAVQCALAVLWAFVAHKWYFHSFRPAKTLIIYDHMASQVNELLKKEGMDIRFKVVGVEHVSKFQNGDMSRLEGIDAVFLSGVHSHERNQLLKYCTFRDINAYVIPRVGDVILTGAQKIYMLNLPILKVSRYNPAHEYLFIKRFFDIVLSAIAIGIASPVMLVLAIIIKRTDGGPVLYRQVRLTRYRREFEMLKFRSMIPDAEKDGVARLSTGENDKRVTKVGRFMRRYRLDELPQLFNIIKGDMSLVGPRPERPEIAKVYESRLPEFALRLQVRAGLTGIAQVYGRYNTEPYDKLLLDLTYISKPGLAQDVKVMLATIKTLFIKDSTRGVDAGQVTADISDINEYFRKNEDIKDAED